MAGGAAGVRRLVGVAALVVLGASAFGLGPGAARQVPGDDEDAADREALVVRSLRENCLICHTEDLIACQRLTPAQWKAEVDKMVGWGAPLPREAAGPLVEYLSRRYPETAGPAVPERAALGEVDSLEARPADGAADPSGADLGRGERLYAANCATCHGPEALGGDLGPALVGKAILDHPRDYDRIVDQGLRRMPGFRMTMSPRDQADVRAWLRRRAYPAPVGPAAR